VLVKDLIQILKNLKPLYLMENISREIFQKGDFFFLLFKLTNFNNIFLKIQKNSYLDSIHNQRNDKAKRTLSQAFPLDQSGSDAELLGLYNPPRLS